MSDLRGTGVHYAVQASATREDLLTPRHGEHVWVAMAVYRVSAESLRGKTADRVHLDRENLAMIEIGCYVCGQPWSEQLSYRKCPGELGPGSAA